MRNLLDNVTFPFFDNCLAKKPNKNITFKDLVFYIKSDSNLKKFTEIARKFKKDNNISYYALKKRLSPCIKPSVNITGRRITEITKHTSLIFADFDHISENEIESLTKKLTNDPHVALIYRSISGHGLHVFFHVRAPDTQDCEILHHWHLRIAFPHVNDYCQNHFNKKIDPIGKDIVGACYLCHDPEVYANFHAVPLLDNQIEIVEQDVNTLEIIKVNQLKN